MRTIFFIVALLGIAAASFPAVGSPAYVNDNNVLQYALTLELLEANFYTSGLQRFSQNDFNAAGYTGDTYTFLQIIRDHEISHASSLTQLLQARGQSPATACGYNFGYSSVTEFLATGLILEETGVSAYDGASLSITQDDLRVLASSVASVEARHAAYLNIVNGKQPFYNATDLPLFKPMILAMASQFINGSCPSAANVSAASLFNSSSLLPLSTIQNSTQSTASYNNDNNVIQFALTQEHLEVAFFSTALSTINASTFTTATNRSSTRDYFEIILQHEQAHVASLQALIQARGQAPIANCTQYLFNFMNSPAGVVDFIRQSAQLEMIGVEAFIGASQLVTDPALILLGATVLTLEARHVAYERYLLAEITGNTVEYLPFPNVTDPTSTPAMLQQMQSQFVNLASCPALTLPVPALTFQSNSTIASGSNSSNNNGSSGSSDSNGNTQSGSGSGSDSVVRTGSSSSNSGTGIVVIGDNSSAATLAMSIALVALSLALAL